MNRISFPRTHTRYFHSAAITGVVLALCVSAPAALTNGGEVCLMQKGEIREKIGISNQLVECPTMGTAPSCKGAVSMLDINNATKPSATAKVFNTIYTEGKWGKTKSGTGSTVRATQDLCHVLHAAVVQRLAQKKGLRQNSDPESISILDAPSGDWTWMPSCLQAIAKSLPSVHLSYQGVDVSSVANKIAEHRRVEFERSTYQVKTHTFLQMDLSKPKVLLNKFGADAFDVVISHDALQHNPNENVRSILQNFGDVGKLLVLDIDRAGGPLGNYRDISAGADSRRVDITQPPFSFSAICMDENQAQHCREDYEWFGIFHLPLVSRAEQ